MVQIITDSCADLTVAQLEKYGIDYAKMMTVCGGVERVAALEWSPEEVHAHYETMRRGERITTAQVPIEEFERIFELYLAKGVDIVYVGCSSKQSGSVHTGEMVSKWFEESYPERKIVCVDSLNASMGEGMLAIEAAKLAREGKSAEEIREVLLSMRKRVNQYVTVHSLDALARAGRLKSTSAFFGNLIGVKPILISDANGYQVAYKKVKGRGKSLSELVSLLKESIIAPEEQTLYLTHADCSPEEIERVVSLLKSEIPCKDVEIGYIGPIIGASIGPDAIGIWGFGGEVTHGAEGSSK